MIAHLRGTLLRKELDRAVVDVGGVGYLVHVSAQTASALPAEGAPVELRCHTHVREDALQIFGFAEATEQAAFELLILVSGIGPKLALTALSGLSIKDLKASIAQADVKRLSSISGIGKKTAERIVVELRDKLGAGEAMEAITAQEEMTPENARTRDAILALVSLGYKQAEAQQLVRTSAAGATPDMTVEEIVRRALAR